MNRIILNTINLDGDSILVKKGGGGGNSGGDPGGGDTPVVVAASSDDVVFIDYDGTILHNYSKDEFLALEEMPPLPSQPGLICQEWNWDFNTAKTYVNKYGMLVVGATYITDDNKTRLYIHVDPFVKYVTLNTIQELNTASVNWGDGTIERIDWTSGSVAWTHEYSKGGDYCIEIEVDEGNVVYLGNSWATAVTAQVDKVFIGKNMGLKAQAFNNVPTLEVISIPNGATTSFDSTLFAGCPLLRGLVIPKSVINIEDAFNGTSNLEYCSVSQNTTGIVLNSFLGTRSLKKLTIPEGCTQFPIIEDGDIEKIVMPDSITSMGHLTRCQKLKHVKLSNNITELPNSALSSCAIENINLPTRLTKISEYAFQESPIKSISIPSSVTFIGDAAFQNCRKLRELIIPNSVTELGNSLVYSCDSIKNVVFPNTMQTLKGYTLTSGVIRHLKIPKSVTTIEDYALPVYNVLEVVDFSEHTSVPVLMSEFSLEMYGSYRILVPDALYDEWIVATNWTTFVDKIIKVSEYEAL